MHYSLLLALALYSICSPLCRAEDPTVLRGHDTAVRVVRFSPDDKLLATGSFDGQVIIFDSATWKAIKTFPKDTGVDLAFSPDGGAIAFSGAVILPKETIGKIKVWDLHTQSFRFTVTIPGGGTCVAFAPDGKSIASGSGYQETDVKLWDAITGTEQATLKGHKTLVTAIAYSPDRKFLATGDKSGIVKLWDPATKKLIKTIESYSRAAQELAFSPDSKVLAVGHEFDINTRKPHLKLWKIPTFEESAALESSAVRIHPVSFSPKGKYLAAGGDASLAIWDLALKKQHSVLRGHADFIWSVSYSPVGGMIATGGNDHTVRVWHAPKE
jgi:WD40 repeat protein